MANDVPVTPGSGVTIATDEVAGRHIQLVKLVDGTEDGAARIPGDSSNGLSVFIRQAVPGTGATNLGKAEDVAHASGDVGVAVWGVRNDAGTVLAGTTGDYIPLSMDASGYLRVNVAAGAFTLANGADPLTVGGKSDLLAPTITTSTTPAYSIGDVVGGRIQIVGALGTLRTGILQSIVVSFASANTPALDILIFDAQPTQNTADNAAFAWNSADDAKVIWKQSVETIDYFTVPGATARTFASISPFAPILKSNGSADLWIYIITRSGFTAASTSSMRVKLGIGKD